MGAHRRMRQRPGSPATDESVVVLITNPGLPNEERQVLAAGVAPYLAGEVPNGFDDNFNGIEDERGLSLVLQETVLVVRISMQAPGPDGVIITRTVQSKVTLRN